MSKVHLVRPPVRTWRLRFYFDWTDGLATKDGKTFYVADNSDNTTGLHGQRHDRPNSSFWPEPEAGTKMARENKQPFNRPVSLAPSKPDGKTLYVLNGATRLSRNNRPRSCETVHTGRQWKAGYPRRKIPSSGRSVPLHAELLGSRSSQHSLPHI